MTTKHQNLCLVYQGTRALIKPAGNGNGKRVDGCPTKGLKSPDVRSNAWILGRSEVDASLFVMGL